MPTILLAEANRYLREAYEWFLSRHDFHITTAADGLDCLARLRVLVPDFLILDLDLLWGGGDGILALVRENPRLLPAHIVLTSTVNSPAVFDGLESLPVVRVLTKPFAPAALLKAMMPLLVPARGEELPLGLEELQEQLQHRLSGRVHEFRLLLRNRELILRGLTHSYYAKQLAQHAVMESIGLPIRANEIEVV